MLSVAMPLPVNVVRRRADKVQSWIIVLFCHPVTSGGKVQKRFVCSRTLRTLLLHLSHLLCHPYRVWGRRRDKHKERGEQRIPCAERCSCSYSGVFQRRLPEEREYN